MKRDIELTIERLVLDGVGVDDPQALRRALESSLTELLAERGLPPALAAAGDRRAIDQMDAGTVTFRSTGKTQSSAADLGPRLATAIHRGMGR